MLFQKFSQQLDGAFFCPEKPDTDMQEKRSKFITDQESALSKLATTLVTPGVKKPGETSVRRKLGSRKGGPGKPGWFQHADLEPENVCPKVGQGSGIKSDSLSVSVSVIGGRELKR